MKRLSVVWAGLFLLAACQDASRSVGPEAVDASLSAASAGQAEMIVLLDPAFAPGGHAQNQATARAVAAEFGITPRHAYGTAVFGFSGVVPEGRLQGLERDPRVVHVEPVEAWPLAVDFAALAAAQSASQVLPTGIDRAEVDLNPNVSTDGTGTTVNLDIAIIDTGIADHVDLNIGRKVSFSGGDGNDKNGHGTHVAGSVAGIDNSVGVVGVAPGARVHAVQVCKPGGLCFTGDMVAGIDWVAARKSDANNNTGDPIDFAAANFSISSADSNNSCDNPANAVHDAICGVVEQGVVFGLAAGNDGREKTPFPVAFSVAAIADFDGKAGAAGSPTCRTDEDDTLANFSNFGSTVDIAAPGVCILSTWNDGGYNTISGTSMATPHVTGAVALYLHANGLSPATNGSGADNIKNAVVGAAHPEGTENEACSYDNEEGTSERLLFVNGTAFGGDGSCEVAGEEPAPDPETTGTIAGTVTDAGTVNGIGDATVSVEGTSLSATTDANGDYSIGDVPTGTHDVTASADGFQSQTKSATVNENETTTVDFALEESTGGDNPPQIDVFNVTTRITGPWFRADVEWAVSDLDGDLASVVTELLDSNGVVLERLESSVSGSSASGTHNHRTTNGDASSVLLTVTDVAGNQTSDTRTVLF